MLSARDEPPWGAVCKRRGSREMRLCGGPSSDVPGCPCCRDVRGGWQDLGPTGEHRAGVGRKAQNHQAAESWARERLWFPGKANNSWIHGGTRHRRGISAKKSAPTTLAERMPLPHSGCFCNRPGSLTSWQDTHYFMNTYTQAHMEDESVLSLSKIQTHISRGAGRERGTGQCPGSEGPGDPPSAMSHGGGTRREVTSRRQLLVRNLPFFQKPGQQRAEVTKEVS